MDNLTTSTATTRTDDAVLLAADRLARASASGIACAPVRDLIGRGDVDAAYAVQRMLVAQRIAAGARAVGRKIGLTSPGVRAQLGVDRPDFGVLFADMQYASGDIVPADAVPQPRAEAEIAFVLGADLADGNLDAGPVRQAIDHAVAAVEICGSRIQDWDITFADTVADNASSGAFVLGSVRRGLDEFEPRDVSMTMSVEGEEVSAGSGAACLGDPITAVVWLARQLRDLGCPLRSGELVLSGALGPMRPIRSGQVVNAEFSALGSVSFTFGGVAR
ncbi:fumarylacetoacetate hydrolase family protein [Micromonospora sp. NBC_01392]|uniref:2-keto-4-pentenoate hydratase n=1 Tax=Micromonospora sp. NBC_01392 TaxID=2903588 RepID=UPI00324D88BE